MGNARLIFGLILVVAGMGALLGINIWNYFWPVMLILVGLRMINRSEIGHRDWEQQTEVNQNSIEETIIFNGINRKIISSDFKGGKITTIFGGGELDLSETKIKEGKTVDLEVTSIFGGYKIIVPKSWSVGSSVTGIFGGFDNRTQMPDEKKTEGRMNINGAAIFGGGEVVN